jgi:UDP-N-acetyl-D-mannosaminuronate dehydrogenase
MRLASSKWNFIKFKPGLVGGHCLPVDPYYFSFIAKKNLVKTKVTLAGRETNNEMEKFIFSKIKNDILNNYRNKKILITGLTYKANVPDMRNSLSLNIFIKLRNFFSKKYIYGYEPLISKKKAKKYNLENNIISKNYECTYVLTDHQIFKKKLKNFKTKYLFKDI